MVCNILCVGGDAYSIRCSRSLKQSYIQSTRAAVVTSSEHVPRGLYRERIPTLGPKACKYCLHWAIWIPGMLEIAEGV